MTRRPPAPSLYGQRPGALRILDHLMRHPGKAFARATLAKVAALDPESPPKPEIVKVHICRLRKALPHGRIETLHRTTYRWIEEVPQ